MIEALLYGIAAALAFIGFVFLIILALLHVFRTENTEYIIVLDKNTDKEKIQRLVSAAYLRSVIFGGLLSDKVTVIDSGLSEDGRQILSETAAQLSGIRVITADEFTVGKEKDGSGA